MEGCGFRDLQSDFDEAGVRIIGVSFDTPEANRAWRTKKGFTFELWTDRERELALYYGAAKDKGDRAAARVSHLLDAEGQLLFSYNVGLKIPVHPRQVLDDVHAWQAGRAAGAARPDAQREDL